MSGVRAYKSRDSPSERGVVPGVEHQSDDLPACGDCGHSVREEIYSGEVSSFPAEISDCDNGGNDCLLSI